MNTIEFAIKDGVPYAIDFLNPAPDFERDRITDYYSEMVVEKMANLVIDRALSGEPSQSWPRWEEMLGHRAGGGFTGRARQIRRLMRRRIDAPGIGAGTGAERERSSRRSSARRSPAAMRARKLTFGDRIHSPFLRPFFLSAADEARIRRASETIAAHRGAGGAGGAGDPGAVRATRDHRGGGAADPHRSRLRHR